MKTPKEEKKPTMEETREFLGLPPIEEKVDIEKLARERYPHSKYAPAPDYLAQGFIDGYNQAIKDNAKQYTDKRKLADILPTDEEVGKWFDENIATGCSASSGIYKFRLWLRDRNEHWIDK